MHSTASRFQLEDGTSKSVRSSSRLCSAAARGGMVLTADMCGVSSHAGCRACCCCSLHLCLRQRTNMDLAVSVPQFGYNKAATEASSTTGMGSRLLSVLCLAAKYCSSVAALYSVIRRLLSDPSLHDWQTAGVKDPSCATVSPAARQAGTDQRASLKCAVSVNSLTCVLRQASRCCTTRFTSVNSCW